MFCVECGREAEKTFDGLCVRCYIKSKNFFFLPTPIKIARCQHCGRYKKKNRWIDYDPSKIIRDSVQIDEELENPLIKIESSNDLFLAKCQGFVMGIPVEETHSTEIMVEKEVCDRCSKIKGGYFEAILQVRAANRDLSNGEIERVNEIIKKAVKIEEINGGMDYYIEDKNQAESLAKLLKKEFCCKMKKSASLTGRKDGRNVYRMTYLVRISEYKNGDFIEIGNEIFKILKMGEIVKMMDLSSMETRHYSIEKLEKGKIINVEERMAVVVYEDGELHLMDPWTYEMKVVKKPENFDEIKKKKEVKVIKWKGKLYLVCD